MDRLQLKQCLQAAGVPDDRYLLVGLDQPRAVREGACIVRPNQRSWEVLVWEPVRLQPSLTFLNEGEACEYVLDILTATVHPPTGAVATPLTARSDAESVPGAWSSGGLAGSPEQARLTL
jgi:hypothetical protein